MMVVQMQNNTDQIIAILLIGFIVIFFLYIIPQVIIFWKLFKKAGQPGWAAIVPVYNAVVMSKIAKKPLWLGLVVGVSGISSSGSSSVGQSQEIIEILLSTIYIVFGLYLLSSFIRQYDRGIGTWFVYIFIPLIGVFMVKNAQYKSEGSTQVDPVQNQTVAPVNNLPVQAPLQQEQIQPQVVMQQPTQQPAAPIQTQPYIAPQPAAPPVLTQPYTAQQPQTQELSSPQPLAEENPKQL